MPEGMYGNDFVEDDRTMAFSVSVAYTPSVMACAMTAPPTQGSLTQSIQLPTAPHPATRKGGHLPPGEGYFAHRRQDSGKSGDYTPSVSPSD